VKEITRLSIFCAGMLWDWWSSMSEWNEIQALAQAEVEATVASLPVPLRRHAQPLAVSYESRPGRALLREGYEEDLLGLFIGPALAQPDESPLPPQIVLFLRNLWDFAEGDRECFREEVRTTYLHELGHYLGLDEVDLEERGLE
jgi:predicted Zn-dependent protease with MMP-like domain